MPGIRIITPFPLLTTITDFIFSGQIQIDRNQIIHEPGEIRIPNRKFKGAARWQQGLCLWDHGFQLHHFMNVIIRQNGEAGLVEGKGLFNPFFNARMKGGAKDQGIIRFSVRYSVQPFHISQAVSVWAFIKEINPAVGNSHCFTPFTIFLKVSKPSGYRMKPKQPELLIWARLRF